MIVPRARRLLCTSLLLLASFVVLPLTVAISVASTRGTPGSSHWQIHRTIRQLEDEPGLSPVYEETTQKVLNVLREWSVENTGQPLWQSLLNKSNLRHEVEESIVALHFLQQWSSSSPQSSSFTAVDVCCGKGVFSMLLSYLAPRQEFGSRLDRIILMDKDQKINWSHVEAANGSCREEGRPFLELWAGANIHKHDDLVDRFLSYNQTLAFTGIHLCKTLSPAMVGIVNALGSKQAPYLCLAPCCLPRIQQLEVTQFEDPLQRNARLNVLRQRITARERFECFVCQGDHHVRNCPEKDQYSTKEDWDEAVLDALVATPCWNCGKTGHRGADCTESRELRLRPTTTLDMNLVTAGINPFETYCGLLSKTIQDVGTIRVIDSGLSSTSCREKQHGNNWNQNRKAVFIVVSRECSQGEVSRKLDIT